MFKREVDYLLKSLLASYPLSLGFQSAIVKSVLYGVFVGLFLWVFTPFGIQRFSDQIVYQISVGHGLITFLVVLLINWPLRYLFPRIFDTEKWNAIKEISFILLGFLFVGAANSFFLGFYFNIDDDPISTYAYVLSMTVLVGIIPVTLTILIKQNWLLRKHIKEARYLDERSVIAPNSDSDIRLYNEKKELEVQLSLSEFILAKASGNYLEILHEENGGLRKFLLRNRLQNIVRDNPSPGLFRCHRGYLINLYKVKNVTGNTRGYSLTLLGIEEKIPVSRNYITSFNKAFRR